MTERIQREIGQERLVLERELERKISEFTTTSMSEISHEMEEASRQAEALQNETRDFLSTIAESTKAEITEAGDTATAEAKSLRDLLEARYAALLESPALKSVVTSAPSARELRDRMRGMLAGNQYDEIRDSIRGALATLADGNPASQRMNGDRDDWFNLGAALGQIDEYTLALEVTLAGLVELGMLKRQSADEYAVRKGTGSTPPYVDLMAHAVQYATSAGRNALADCLVKICVGLPEETRNWRYYEFLARYYSQKNDKKAFDGLIRDYRQRLPENERWLSSQIEWHETRNEPEKVFELGDEWLAAMARGDKGFPRRSSSAALRLTDLALRHGRYEDVVRYSAIGLEGHAEAQPNASHIALLSMRAFAFDSMLTRLLATPDPDEERAKELYRKAATIYLMKEVQSENLYGAAARRRLSTLQLLMKERFPDFEGEDSPAGRTMAEDDGPGTPANGQNGTGFDPNAAMAAILAALANDDHDDPVIAALGIVNASPPGFPPAVRQWLTQNLDDAEKPMRNRMEELRDAIPE